MLYEKFLEDEEIVSLLEELKEHTNEVHSSILTGYKNELDEQLNGEGDVYTMPIEIIEDAEKLQENFYKVFTKNNMLTLIMIKKMENEGNISLTLENFLKILNNNVLIETINYYLTLTPSDFQNTFIKPWLTINDKFYENNRMVKIIAKLTVSDLKLFIMNFSSFKHSSDYMDTLISVYEKYYPTYYKELKANAVEIEKYNGGNYRDKFHGVNPLILTLFIGWRDNYPSAPLVKFIKYLHEFAYDGGVSYFYFLKEEPLAAFEEFTSGESPLGAKVYFQLFNYMIRRFGDDYFDEYRFDPYHSINTAQVVSFEDFKNHYMPDTPIEWIMEFCTIEPQTFDDTNIMHYEI